MATFLVANPKFAAGRAPFRSMRQDAAPPGAKLRQQMRQFVTQRAIDLGGADFAKSRIQ